MNRDYVVGKGKPPKDKQFTSENQPLNKGRKKNKLKEFIEENEISSIEIAAVIKNVIFEKDIKELKELVEDEKQPMLIRLFIRAFLEDFKRGKLDNINKLMDRAIGTVISKQEIEHSGGVQIVFDKDDKDLL